MMRFMRGRMARRLLAVGIIAVLAWASLGAPQEWFANQFWPDDAAPWEKVTAVYYPDKSDRTVFKFAGENFENAEKCRDVIMKQAAANNDPQLERGSYECAVGFYSSNDHTGHYRLKITP
ncbi:hypothetical protein [Thalassospira mesophila]|uniref:Uncharacterized protein n=1 Tax=Thalassospira mesophila TaxID=1293891 RepID=A0A1Y2L0L6_9PROT|nr:hypothetical protein [Thalassospira mesophila]OSQ38768.1 hypothetical protein TMES_08195 [Thalassospira mesophila]